MESYEGDKNNLLRQELESLKPNGKVGFISWAISSLFAIFFIFYILNYTELDIFADNIYLIIIVLLLLPVSHVKESIRINKRIDILIKLLDNGAFRQNT
ncbi:MAG: hypothetical protein OCD00_13185 [Colwellia sp.]